MKVYADNAATTKMSRNVIEAMMSCMLETCGNPSSTHLEGQKAKNALEDARRRAAGILNCRPSEIYFTSSGSEADNQALLSAAAAGAGRGKKHIISSAFEHKAVLNTLSKLKKSGFEVQLLTPPEDGVLKVSQIKAAIREDTAFVSVMYANNEIGTIQPISEIGALCREKHVIFHTDAVQAAGHIPVDVRRDNIDMLSLSAHKFHGPKGIGLLYSGNGIEPVCLIEGGGQERGKRAGTENLPGIIGLAAALEEAAGNMETVSAAVVQKRDYIISLLNNVEGAKLNGDAERRLPGNVNFCFEGVDGETLLMLLDEKGISASSGSACMAGSLEPSHVLTAIGRTAKEAEGSLRLSLGDDITWEEAEYLAVTVKDAVEKIRRSK